MFNFDEVSGLTLSACYYITRNKRSITLMFKSQQHLPLSILDIGVFCLSPVILDINLGIIWHKLSLLCYLKALQKRNRVEYSKPYTHMNWNKKR